MNGTRKRLALRFVPEQGENIAWAVPNEGEAMSPEQFRSIRKQAGLDVRELAALLRISDWRAVIRYEKGERIITGPVSIVMEMIADGRHG